MNGPAINRSDRSDESPLLRPRITPDDVETGQFDSGFLEFVQGREDAPVQADVEENRYLGFIGTKLDNPSGRLHRKLFTK